MWWGVIEIPQGAICYQISMYGAIHRYQDLKMHPSVLREGGGVLVICAQKINDVRWADRALYRPMGRLRMRLKLGLCPQSAPSKSPSRAAAMPRATWIMMSKRRCSSVLRGGLPSPRALRSWLGCSAATGRSTSVATRRAAAGRGVWVGGGAAASCSRRSAMMGLVAPGGIVMFRGTASAVRASRDNCPHIFLSVRENSGLGTGIACLKPVCGG